MRVVKPGTSFSETWWMHIYKNALNTYIPRHIQGQAGWGTEQTDLFEDVPAHYRGVGLGDL